MITIRHTHADGTLIEGSRKGDGVYQVLKGMHDNWRYFPSIEQIGIGHSRDRLANTHKINRAAEALRAAGHEVTVEVDEGDRRSFAEAEQDRYDRADDRADRMAGYATNAAARSDAAYQGARQIMDSIPMGQPVLLGHHSQRRHERDLERIDRGLQRTMEEGRKAEHYAHRAENAESYQESRESVPVTLRRIAKLEADERRVKRDLIGRVEYVSDGTPGGYKPKLVRPEGEDLERLQILASDLADQLAHWRGVVANAQESGVKVWTRDDFAKGDYVLRRGCWYPVLRVNAKSVSIPNPPYDGPAWTVGYDDIRGRRSPEEMQAAAAEAKAAKAAAS